MFLFTNYEEYVRNGTCRLELGRYRHDENAALTAARPSKDVTLHHIAK